MPHSTAKRVADPVMLERIDPPSILRHAGELVYTYRNILATSLLQGEPVVIANKVCLTQRVILPGAEGRCIPDWVADFVVNPALAANILQNDSVWWSYDVTALSDDDGVAFNGAVVNSAPTNGFILGRALIMPGDTRVNGSSKPIAAAAGDVRIRVASGYQTYAAIGTVPVFN